MQIFLPGGGANSVYIKRQFNHLLAFDQAQVKNEFSLPRAANLLTKQNTCWLMCL